jgi:hypothetical protein
MSRASQDRNPARRQKRSSEDWAFVEKYSTFQLSGQGRAIAPTALGILVRQHPSPCAPGYFWRTHSARPGSLFGMVPRGAYQTRHYDCASPWLTRGGIGRRRFRNAWRAEETGAREVLRLVCRMGCGVLGGGWPSAVVDFCASHRRSTGTGHRARSHSQEYKTRETP